VADKDHVPGDSNFLDGFAVIPSSSSRHLNEAQLVGIVGSWELDFRTRTFAVSDTVQELHGVPLGGLAQGYQALRARVHSQDRQAISDSLRRLLAGESYVTARYRVCDEGDDDGAPRRWLHSRSKAFRDEEGTLLRIVGSVADITEHVQSEDELRRAHAELSQAHSYEQAVITASPDAIHIFDVELQAVFRANRLAPELIGYTDAMISVMSGKNLDRLLPADDLLRFNAALDGALHSPDGEVVQLRHRVVDADGSVRWLSRRMTPFQRSEGGEITQVLIVSRDVSDVVAVEERLEHAALHDELTGLPNRRLVRDRLEHALQRSERRGHVAVLFCDLDGFKRINDSHGHPVGDNVLVATARRLSAATRAGDTVARMGGDEFVVMVEVPSSEDPATLAEVVAERIEAAMSDPILVDNDEHNVTVSIGICVAEDGCSAESLLSDADTAMYFAKSKGSNGHAVFAPELRRDTIGRDHIERQIRRALSAEGVEAYFQPIVNPVDGSLYGVEALVRITDADGQLLDTGKVISVAEQTGLITALDETVLRLSAAQVAAWRATPDRAQLMLTVNCSARNIAQPGFYDRIHAALADTGLEPSALTIEVTETVLLDVADAALNDLRRLRRDGIGLAIDDFGTGYASLRYLATLPITCLKIDRSFTNGLPQDETCMTLVRTTIGLAEDLGIRCVVEGVESTQQLAALPRYDGLLIQGYLYGRPQPAKSLTVRRLRASRLQAAS
jgi:diguanylate cyclase (GGDEF)-like protein/PAS domain S-box-containing protein